MAFGASSACTDGGALSGLRALYPDAHIVGCSTAGEICGTSVLDGSMVATAIHFEHSSVQVARRSLPCPSASAEVGELLGRALDPNGLVHAIVLAEGLNVNGSALVAGLRNGLPPHVAATGGLAGDADRFERTYVCFDGEPCTDTVAIVGLYGDRLHVGYGSMGGWDVFGPEREVTWSEGNVVFELDGEPALDLYKRYLGPHADGLPASGLRFPLSLRAEDGGQGVVRTILSMDETRHSITFAGDVPQGAFARLMKANVDRLVDGATSAAIRSNDVLGGVTPELAILISCVGRKLILQQRIEEEVEAARDVLGVGAALAGFYSYGEIAPFLSSTTCELHNETMTITTFSER